jgi:prefoldin subunit 5
VSELVEDLKIANDNLYCANQMLEKEIERLNKELEEYQKALDETISEKIDLENIIKEVREYIESYNLPKDLGHLGEAPISIRELRDILEILDKADKENKQ